MKERLDTYLVNNNYYPTRNRAKLAIENGDILVDEKIITKVSYLVDETNTIKIIKESIPYVSRGGLKLAKALDVFQIEVKGKICLDIGASSGGFSDCLLQNEARKVYAIDVGSNQLVGSLKNNPKLISMENTNFRNLDLEQFKDLQILVITCDVSFISLAYMFANVSKLLAKNGVFIALIKPQFEVSKNEHNKKGKVNDKKLHFKVIKNLMEKALDYHLYLNKLDYSPIKGEKSGNIEYLGLFSFTKKNINLSEIDKIIEIAFKELN